MAQVLTLGIHAPHPAGGLKSVQTALLPFCDSGRHPSPHPAGGLKPVQTALLGNATSLL
jgi:hypothetical protein